MTAFLRHERRQVNTRQVAHSTFIGRCVFKNFRAKIRGFDGTEVLLVGFSIAGVLVEHVRRASLDLRGQDRHPELLCGHYLACLALALVASVQGFELGTPHVLEIRQQFKPKKETKSSRKWCTCKPGASLGQKSDQVPLLSTRFIKRSEIHIA